jgi:hypothetical protein
MNRTPPIPVLRQLRREVAFGCPVPRCGSPYLTWHHFDPLWKEREHHEPSGMIALCREHHDQADAGAFKAADLRRLKLESGQQALGRQGEFNWRRNRLLVVLGNIMYYEPQVIFELNDEDIIWISRDEGGRMLLNLRSLSLTEEPRLMMLENFWLAGPGLKDLVCPPSGRLIDASYPNGDKVRIEFSDLPTFEELVKHYPVVEHMNEGIEDLPIVIEPPITVVEIAYRVAGAPIDFGPKGTRLGNISIATGFSSHAQVAVSLRLGPRETPRIPSYPIPL